jgi:hypothetical protein
VTGYRRGKTSGSAKLKGATGMKEGRKGDGRRKASRGRGSPRTPRSRGRHPRHESLPTSACAEEHQTPWEAAAFRTRAGQNPVTVVRGALGTARCRRRDDSRATCGSFGVRAACRTQRELPTDARPLLVARFAIGRDGEAERGVTFSPRSLNGVVMTSPALRACVRRGLREEDVPSMHRRDQG